MSETQDTASGDGDDLITGNAELFARSFAGLNQVFSSEGSISILSEEEEMTVAVGVRPADDSHETDVDCVLFESNQESLRDCLDTLFEEH